MAEITESRLMEIVRDATAGISPTVEGNLDTQDRAAYTAAKAAVEHLGHTVVHAERITSGLGEEMAEVVYGDRG